MALEYTEEDKIVLTPLLYFKQNKSDVVVELSYNCCNYWIKVPEKEFLLSQEICKSFISFVLCLDDICDNSKLRQEYPCAFRVYGVPWTVNSVTFMLQLVLKKWMELGGFGIVDILYQSMTSILVGHSFEIYFRHNGKCPTEEEYMNVVIEKTVSAADLVVKHLQYLHPTKENYVDVLRKAYRILQIANDYHNLKCKTYTKIKGFCEDLDEGTFTFPIIHAINNRPEDTTLLDVVRRKNADFETKKMCVELLEKYGSFEYTKKKLEELSEELFEDMEKLPPNPFISLMLKEVVDTIDTDNPVLGILKV